MSLNTNLNTPDIDSQETQEWLDALMSVIENEGPERAHFLLEAMIDKARRTGANLPYNATTAYLNTIPTHLQSKLPGDPEMERRIRALVRWNAIMTVLRANEKSPGVGGHIASFQSAATLYDTGFNYFFRAPTENFGGDCVYFQGHSSPGVYARAYLEGRITEEQMDNFRQETGGNGLPSYPHPWLMPDFWQFPTVSMGLGPLAGIYQARFLKYIHDRGIADTSDRKVWVFCGDGEMDEPESLGAISLATREKLDNLIFVINCNLQRLDGPVRGNGKIIQELESDFRGSGWNVLKVVWGSYWDPLLAMDKDGLLKKRMEECVDGEYQNFKQKGGAYTREHFFGKYPELKAMVAAMSDQDIWRLNRGGHDPHKVYAAYDAAVNHKGQPTVILAKTVKGYGMGEAGEGQNTTHQQKSMDIESLKKFRDRFDLPLTDAQVESLSYYKPAEDSPEMKYMAERRAAMGGFVPQRRRKGNELKVPQLSAFENMLAATGEREISTTMAFVRILSTLVRDKEIGKFVVPIVPDEARTFGMEGMFRQLGIYASQGQLYEPQDSDQVMFYKESKDGQILEEGINEAGAFSSWLAAATSYSVTGKQMIPFYIYYSMFGFQRIGDLAWLAGDSRARGFLLGATAGRTTLNGEGLQHEDGHSHLMSATIPNCVSYDPTFAYELAVIIQDGLRRMVQNQEDVYYYITLMNENYTHPEMPKGAEAGILKGMYNFSKSKAKGEKVQLMGSGVILREVIAAAELLEKDWGIAADVWSVPSFTELRREGLDCERWNMLNPEKSQRVSYVAECLKDAQGPVIASTDYMKSFAEQIQRFVPNRFVALGTDGFGRSDSREALRDFFEVNKYYVVVAALKALSDDGKLPAAKVAEAVKKYKLDANKPNPTTV
ncbi:MAG: pyruvate dehydrogenase (acetyl-transferring), homodimeric type [Methylotenera sp. 24-45-7]|nr:MAG: pyruvate dehydrogenase (acetyl-transferring), homodimeric type [Methylotenera sp. 24-45-7]OZA53990.1 MAG: pyruvate dehydrogenase (acetyl-transferring), homodimeric type [Methylophilales bacterium 39-45-7]HQS37343.1 pyruvate dehydrogenase (acetyl-transferring), homodimeric type [Methylotenera sp.]HQS44162.1 pyruvate dehydrogenase (acetyl-transferring), homodimeric type [Methylotenera sp.]